eukprot:581119-Pelagomonas_calceolata.AAC.1
MLGGCCLQARQGVGTWAIFKFNMSCSVGDRTYKDSIRAAFVSGRGAITRREDPAGYTFLNMFSGTSIPCLLFLLVCVVGPSGKDRLSFRTGDLKVKASIP